MSWSVGSAVVSATLATQPSTVVATHFAFDDFPSSGTVLSNATERSFVANLYDAGAFTVVGPWTDTDFRAIAPGDLIAFDVTDKFGTPVRAFAGIVRTINYVVLDPGESAQQLITVSGEGHLAILTDGLIEPPGGEGRFPIVDDFVFDFTHPEFDDSGWTTATEVSTVYAARRTLGGGPSDYATPGVDGIWAYLQVFQPISDFTPPVSVIPDGSPTSIIWASDGTIDGLTTGVGDCYFRDTFTTSYDGMHLLFLAADNQAELWIDGKQIEQVGFDGDVRFSGYETGGGSPVTVSLSAGTHTVAMKATNLPPFGVPNPGGVAASIWVPGYPPTLVWETTPAMKILEYAAETPGMTPGTDLRLMVESQQTLGRWSFLTLDCTDDDDTNNDAWNVTPTLSVKVGGDTIYTATLKLITLYADVVMDPSDWLLHAYNKDAAGGTSGVALEQGNLTLLRFTREDLTSDELLVRSELGWSRDGSSGRREGYLELGSENNADEVTRVSDTVLGVYSSPREQVEVAYLPRDHTEIPWVNTDFVPGSTVTVPTRGGGTTTDRALSIGMSYAKDTLSITLKVKDVVLSNQERLLEMVKQR